MINEVEPSLYKNFHSLIRWQKQRAIRILEEEFCLNHNDSTKRSSIFFTPGFLPTQYYYAHSPRVIARHIIMVTQFLDCNSDIVSVESKEGRMITYFCNVGYDVPGILLRLFKENLDMDINGFDSIYTPAGYRIITFHKRLHELPYFDEEAQIQAQVIFQMVRNTGNPHTEVFLQSLPKNYMIEEICSHRKKPRILRHLEMFSLAMTSETVQVTVSKTADEKLNSVIDGNLRINICVKNASNRFVLDLLQVVQSFQINMIRSYFDQFYLPDHGGTIKLFSIYIDETKKLDQLLEKIREIKTDQFVTSAFSEEGLEQEMGLCIREISDEKRTVEDCVPIIDKLKQMAMQNIDITKEGEFNNFYLNTLSEFFKAAEIVGLDKQYDILRSMMRYENVEEFFVETKDEAKSVHKKGYRLRHSSTRGPAKGGLRLHPLAELSEVGALSFMMTWKCAKTRIKFGGGKGGATMNPKEFKDHLDYNLAISGFGKSLFMVTGPFLDVPAGDVNCGGPEIGRIFEGYRAALRDLVSLVYASKFGAARIGKKIVNVCQAREILEHNFEIDPYDDDILKLLMTSDHYLSLVVASQITGKPKMGVNVRNGATGRGLCYCLLAIVGNLYLDGKWNASAELDEKEKQILGKFREIGEKVLVKDSPKPLVSPIEWDQLVYIIFPKLLKGKTVSLQGAGKVGISFIEELEKFGVRVIAVADASGAVLGDDLKVKDLVDGIVNGGGVIHTKNGVTKVIEGTKEGSMVLTVDCDLLLPCALENAITIKNAKDIKAKLIVSGANGPISPKGAEVLYKNGAYIVYDFLANSGGVTASYFEWLRGLAERFRFESEEIKKIPFEISVMDKYIMPEFRTRLREILTVKESPDVDKLWEEVLRDIMVAGVNDDYRRSQVIKARLKISGFVDSLLRVLAAFITKLNPDASLKLWQTLPEKTRGMLVDYLKHPELHDKPFKDSAQKILESL